MRWKLVRDGGGKGGACKHSRWWVEVVVSIINADKQLKIFEYN
jgi:hypothetical protein